MTVRSGWVNRFIIIYLGDNIIDADIDADILVHSPIYFSSLNWKTESHQWQKLYQILQVTWEPFVKEEIVKTNDQTLIPDKSFLPSFNAHISTQKVANVDGQHHNYEKILQSEIQFTRETAQPSESTKFNAADRLFVNQNQQIVLPDPSIHQIGQTLTLEKKKSTLVLPELSESIQIANKTTDKKVKKTTIVENITESVVHSKSSESTATFNAVRSENTKNVLISGEKKRLRLPEPPESKVTKAIVLGNMNEAAASLSSQSSTKNDTINLTKENDTIISVRTKTIVLPEPPERNTTKKQDISKELNDIKITESSIYMNSSEAVSLKESETKIIAKNILQEMGTGIVLPESLENIKTNVIGLQQVSSVIFPAESSNILELNQVNSTVLPAESSNVLELNHVNSAVVPAESPNVLELNHVNSLVLPAESSNVLELNHVNSLVLPAESSNVLELNHVNSEVVPAESSNVLELNHVNSKVALPEFVDSTKTKVQKLDPKLIKDSSKSFVCDSEVKSMNLEGTAEFVSSNGHTTVYQLKDTVKRYSSTLNSTHISKCSHNSCVLEMSPQSLDKSKHDSTRLHSNVDVREISVEREHNSYNNQNRTVLAPDTRFHFENTFTFEQHMNNESNCCKNVDESESDRTAIENVKFKNRPSFYHQLRNSLLSTFETKTLNEWQKAEVDNVAKKTISVKTHRLYWPLYYLSGRFISEKRNNHCIEKNEEVFDGQTKATHKKEDSRIWSAAQRLVYFASGRFIADRDKLRTSEAIRSELERCRYCTEAKEKSSSWISSAVYCLYLLSGRFLYIKQRQLDAASCRLENYLSQSSNEDLTEDEDEISRTEAEVKDLVSQSLAASDKYDEHQINQRVSFDNAVNQHSWTMGAFFCGALVPWMGSVIPVLWHGIEFDPNLQVNSVFPSSMANTSTELKFMGSGVLLDGLSSDS